jgi:hypothetical protein
MSIVGFWNFPSLPTSADFPAKELLVGAEGLAAATEDAVWLEEAEVFAGEDSPLPSLTPLP